MQASSKFNLDHSLETFLPLYNLHIGLVSALVSNWYGMHLKKTSSVQHSLASANVHTQLMQHLLQQSSRPSVHQSEFYPLVHHLNLYDLLSSARRNIHCKLCLQ